MKKIIVTILIVVHLVGCSSGMAREHQPEPNVYPTLTYPIATPWLFIMTLGIDTALSLAVDTVMLPIDIVAVGIDRSDTRKRVREREYERHNISSEIHENISKMEPLPKAIFENPILYEVSNMPRNFRYSDGTGSEEQIKIDNFDILVFVEDLENIDAKIFQEEIGKVVLYLRDEWNLQTRLTVTVMDDEFFKDYDSIDSMILSSGRKKRKVKRVLNKIETGEDIDRSEKEILIDNLNFSRIGRGRRHTYSTWIN